MTPPALLAGRHQDGIEVKLLGRDLLQAANNAFDECHCPLTPHPAIPGKVPKEREEPAGMGECQSQDGITPRISCTKPRPSMAEMAITAHRIRITYVRKA